MNLSKYCLVILLSLSGCATPYGKMSFAGGFSDVKIDENHYRVMFDGNGNTSKEKVWNFWIYRCAELTKEKGFSNFIIQMPVKKSSYFSEQSNVGGDSNGEEWRFIKSYYIYVPSTPVASWHSNAVIAMYHDLLPSNIQYSLKAQSIIDDLDGYVKSNGAEGSVLQNDLLRHAAVINSNYKIPFNDKVYSKYGSFF